MVGKRTGKSSEELMEEVRVVYRRVGKADAMIVLMALPKYELEALCQKFYIPYYTAESKSRVVSRIYERINYLELHTA